MSELLTQTQVTEMTGVSSKTLERWRSERNGPTYVKLGKAVRYRRSDIDAWIAGSAVVARSAS